MRTWLLIGLMTVLVGVGVKNTNSQKPIDPNALTGNYDSISTVGEFHGISVGSPRLLAELNRDVLGDNSSNKRIEVDLSNQRIYAFEDNKKIYDFLVSTGKWGRTPTGTFRIWGKFRYSKMEGGNKAINTYYYLPNVPYVMFFANDKVAASRGFSLHGTYWHSNFGHPMSHGCVNMKTEEAAIIYEWSRPNLGNKKSGRATKEDPGTEIVIYGTPPKS